MEKINQEDIFDNYNTAKEVFKVVKKKNKNCKLTRSGNYWEINYS